MIIIEAIPQMSLETVLNKWERQILIATDPAAEVNIEDNLTIFDIDSDEEYGVQNGADLSKLRELLYYMHRNLMKLIG